MHPLILYNANKDDELERAEKFGADILRLCVEVGGVLTGEHGVGVEKRDLMGTMFSDIDLAHQERVKCAFDPQQLLNPARCSRPCTAAPSSAACISAVASSPSPTSPGSDPAMEVLRPTDARQVAELVAWAAAEETPLEVLGGGSKRALGRPVEAEHAVDLSGLTGISLYEPEELVLSAGVGTTLAEIERTLAAHAQVLAFEPPDLGLLLGAEAGSGTIGGAVACNLAGPRRIKAGAARDHFLGLEAVSGRGEAFKAGGRVMKNVAGYDMCKLLAGAYGTLAAMTRVTLKVLPAPEATRTLLLLGLDPVAATAAMTAALGSSHEVSGAAHLPASVAARLAEAAGAGKSLTAIRVEGIVPSVEARTAALRQELSDYGIGGGSSTMRARAPCGRASAMPRPWPTRRIASCGACRWRPRRGTAWRRRWPTATRSRPSMTGAAASSGSPSTAATTPGLRRCARRSSPAAGTRPSCARRRRCARRCPCSSPSRSPWQS